MEQKENLHFHVNEWPKGLVCMDCEHDFEEEELYSERLCGFYEGSPITEIICLDCVTKQAHEEYEGI